MGSVALNPDSPGEVKSFPALRAEMVKRHIAARGVRDELVLKAMGEVSRELFLPAKLREFAYEDSPLPIAGEQTISRKRSFLRTYAVERGDGMRCPP
ncbi:protein-L-isoaspartate O-methyltransferase [Bradyrhizobium diazoefficiens]